MGTFERQQRQKKYADRCKFAGRSVGPEVCRRSLSLVLSILMPLFRKLPAIESRETNDWWLKKKREDKILCWTDGSGYPYFLIELDVDPATSKATQEDIKGLSSCRKNFQSVVVSILQRHIFTINSYQSISQIPRPWSGLMAERGCYQKAGVVFFSFNLLDLQPTNMNKVLPLIIYFDALRSQEVQRLRGSREACQAS